MLLLLYDAGCWVLDDQSDFRLRNQARNQGEEKHLVFIYVLLDGSVSLLSLVFVKGIFLIVCHDTQSYSSN